MTARKPVPTLLADLRFGGYIEPGDDGFEVLAALADAAATDRDPALMHLDQLANDRQPDTESAFGPPLVHRNLGKHLKNLR